MKKVIMFPGQGSQYKGMGSLLFKKYKTETKKASDILGYDIEELCLNDPRKELMKTQFTQPALYVVNSFNYAEYAQQPDYLIGHSLGEYNALLAARVFDFETGLKLVKKRGALMAAMGDGGMAAVLGLSAEALANELQQQGFSEIDIANYNTPTQTILSGTKSSIDKVVQYLSSKKIQVIPLMVSAAFHSRYMKPAMEAYSAFLENIKFSKPTIPVIANLTARPYDEHKIAETLVNQICGSVQWKNTIQFLMGQQVEEYIEMGGTILTKMVTETRKTSTPAHTQATISPVIKDAIIPAEVPSSESAQPAKTLENDQAKILMKKLGNAGFRTDYGISYSYIAGAMYRGTSSKELVIRMGKAGMLAYLGTAGMSLHEVEKNIDEIQSALKPGQAYGMNLLHHLADPSFEMQTVLLYLRKGIRNVEAAAYMQMSESLVYFLCMGLEAGEDGAVIRRNRILGKVSRPEVAEAFMRPAPDKILGKLLDAGKITNNQVALAKKIPVSIDICVEADSGGHTDGGVAMVLLPSIQRLRDDLQKEYNYPEKIRIGLAGGIGAPQAAASAFVMGADFILTGSINQCTVEAGTSEAVKDLLQGINVQDTDYAPAGDMFEIGAKVQVLKKGVLFPARANKLYNLYGQFDSLDRIPPDIIANLEKNYFKKTISQIWEDTKKYLQEKGQTAEISKAENTPRHKMALVFRWYFGFSSQAAFNGNIEDKVNFQIHTGPAMGAFNQWVKGTEMEHWRNRHVDQIGEKLMYATARRLLGFFEIVKNEM
jgi:trans-AT polyketide synthase, acyltransferase and oxidoreductase domains